MCQELGDLSDAGGLVDESISVPVQDDFLQVLQIRVVNQGPEICPVGRRNWNGKRSKKKGSYRG